MVQKYPRLESIKDAEEDRLKEVSSHEVKEPLVIDMDALRFSPTAVLFEGAQFGGIQATSFIVSFPPGAGVGLHVHPYPEVFILLRGQVRFRVGDEKVEAHADQIVIGRPTSRTASRTPVRSP